jgi:dihydrofolate synthase/folylpolyglutamate synthase
VILDGSHNRQGLEALATTLLDEFPDTSRILVLAMRGHRDVADALVPLAGLFETVVVTAADDPAAIDTAVIAAGVREALGTDVNVVTELPAPQALTEALSHAAEDEIVVVAGSLYLIGEVRSRFD